MNNFYSISDITYDFGGDVVVYSAEWPKGTVHAFTILI